MDVGQRAKLYHTISRLEATGLIAVRHTERDQQFPERTVYELPDEERLVPRTGHADVLRSPPG